MFDDNAGCRDRLVHVCVNVDCKIRGSQEIAERLRDLVHELNLELEINDYICFGACEQGPNLLIEHKRAFYSAVTLDHAEALLRHAEDGPPVAEIDQSDSFIARKIFNLLDAGFRPGDLSLTD